MGDAAGQIASALLGHLLPQARSVQRNAVGGVLIVLFLATAYAALILALWFAVDEVYGPVIASLVVAGGSILLGLIAWGVTSILNRRAERRRRELAQLRAAVSPEVQLAEAALGLLPELVRSKPLLTLACVAVAAFAATKSVTKK
ncbi:hypothetical protein [Rhizobium sp.]|jgi:hypothetical protein|uniref:hypothetical protein n=1 Tax=Rhizobium sp. TaxID=391 RepID=UPI000E9EB897|nr:hypothetical protein [Rhizobium sp.]